MDRSDWLNKSVATLFGRPGSSNCRVCANPLEDGRRRYCSTKCKTVAYAVLELYQWGSIREKVLDRDGHACVRCGTEASEVEGSLEVDHIRPISKDGAALDPRNLQTLCPDCHKAKGTDDSDFRETDSAEKRRRPYSVRDRIEGVASNASRTPDSTPEAVRVLDQERLYDREVEEVDLVEPLPHSSLPDYLTDPLTRQDRESLEHVREYVESKIAYLDQQAALEEASDASITEDPKPEEERTYTYVEKEVNGCGPYTYRRWRDGNGGREYEYVGKGPKKKYTDETDESEAA